MGYNNGYDDGYYDGLRDGRRLASKGPQGGTAPAGSAVVRVGDTAIMVPVGTFDIGGASAIGYRKVTFDPDAAAWSVVDADAADRTVYVRTSGGFERTATDSSAMLSGDAISMTVEDSTEDPLDLYYEDADGNRLPNMPAIGTTD